MMNSPLQRAGALLCALTVGVTCLLPLTAVGQAKSADSPGKDRQTRKVRPVSGPTNRSAKPASQIAPRPDPSALRVAPMPPKDSATAQTPATRSEQTLPGNPAQVPPGGTPSPGGNPPGAGAAPGAGGPPSTPPPFPFAPPGRSFRGGGAITMDFRGSDIANVLKFFAMATNWQIVPDPGLTGQVTIISPKPLTVEQAFQVLQSTLEVRGYSGQLEKRGDTTILKIVALDRAVRSTPLLRGDGQPFNPDELNSQVVTRVIPVDNVDAKALEQELKTLINPGASLVSSAGTNSLIITDTASNVQRMSELVSMLDKSASNTEIQVFPLKHADATQVETVINNLFKRVYTRGTAAPGQPGQRGGGPEAMVVQPGLPGQPGQPEAAQQGRAAVVAVADTRTNSVVVVASKDNMSRVAKLIETLDDEEAAALKTTIYKMKYADAVEVADTLNTILSTSTTTAGRRGQQGASFQQRVFGGGGFFGGGGSLGISTPQQSVMSDNPFAKVVANARTNSLIINATEEWTKRIIDLIKEIDVEVPVETTTFVIPLKNAQAADVAYTLGQAFGTGQQQGFNPFGGVFFVGGTQGRQQRQPIQRRQGQQRTSSPFGRAAATGTGSRAAEIDPDDLNGVHGTMTPDGFIPDGTQTQGDEPTSRQFFFNPFGGGQRQITTPQYGRGQRGNYVNLLQLRNNVGVVPELGSNSLIITTTPDNIEAIREIIEKLDIVPRQVMIEVIIAEATLDATQKLGIQFDARGVGKVLGSEIFQSGSSNFSVGGGNTTTGNINQPISPGAQYGIQAMSGRFNALVQALATDNRVRILSTPKIFTSNNQQAEILITTRIPYVAGTFTGTFGTSSNYDFLDVGITLNVTPRITADGLVTIDVVSDASELLGFDTIASTFDTSGRLVNTLAPRTSQRLTDTSVSVRDGDIVVLGGLMRDNKIISTNKVPLLGDIPLLGHLFRSTTTTTNKTELMIFLIPHVVDSNESNRSMVLDRSKNIRKAVPELQKEFPILNPKTSPDSRGGDKPAEEKPKEEKPNEEKKP